MKRINPETGKIFKRGDVLENGKIFIFYEHIIQDNGYFLERTKKNQEKYEEYIKNSKGKDKNKRNKIEEVINKMMIGEEWEHLVPENILNEIKEIGLVKHNGCVVCNSKDLNNISFENSTKDFFRSSWKQLVNIYEAIVSKCDVYCKEHNEKRIRVGRETQKTGDISEYRAVIKFTKEGWYVFKATSLKGPIDMVIVNEKTGEVRLIDVKTNSYREAYKKTKRRKKLTEEQEKLGVEFVYLDKDEYV